jgi:dUTPase
MIIEKISETALLEVENLDDTVRGKGGFGSTGVGIKDILKENIPSVS